MKGEVERKNEVKEVKKGEGVSSLNQEEEVEETV